MRHACRAAVGACALAALGWHAAHAATCESLAGQSYGDATITASTAVAAPLTLNGPDMRQPITVRPPFCRVQGTIRPSADSDVRFEVWLPPASAWNGKYLGVGNGGFAGSFIYPSMDHGLSGGYAVSATDTGHAGSPIDAKWAVGHPEKVKDFGWRGIHETAAAAKVIIGEYYGRTAAHAYFNGCSDGGREALMEVQRFPDDYDGIVAGAPANAWVKLIATLLWDEQALLRPGAAIPPAKLPAITQAPLQACHGADGIIADPLACRFDPPVLLCHGAATDACLTQPQVQALQKIYDGQRDVATGEAVFPGFQPGSEAGPDGWALWITGPGPAPSVGPLQLAFARGYFADMVYGVPDWNVKTADLDTARADAAQKTGAELDATDTDLSAFKARGGKLLQYHGWYDSAIPTRASIAYYEAVAGKMGGASAIGSFYRLFLAPGMQHCGGGVGPNAVGGVFGLPGPSQDGAHDVVAALDHWVTDGIAPSQIIATKYQDNDPTKPVEAQRPWCPYPQVAHYAGQGSRAAAASYACGGP